MKESIYQDIIHQVDVSLNLTSEEREKLMGCSIARFMAEIPFFSGQKTPDIVGAFNIMTYVSGSRNPEFFARKAGQGIQSRLDSYINGTDGDPVIKSYCKDLLEEVTLRLYNSMGPGLKDIEPLKELDRLKKKMDEYPDEIRDIFDGCLQDNFLTASWLLG